MVCPGRLLDDLRSFPFMQNAQRMVGTAQREITLLKTSNYQKMMAAVLTKEIQIPGLLLRLTQFGPHSRTAYWWMLRHSRLLSKSRVLLHCFYTWISRRLINVCRWCNTMVPSLLKSTGKRSFCYITLDWFRKHDGNWKTHLRNKEVLNAKKVWIICDPKGVLNNVVILNTMLKLRFSRHWTE
jgi:hypothetical protein